MDTGQSAVSPLQPNLPVPTRFLPPDGDLFIRDRRFEGEAALSMFEILPPSRSPPLLAFYVPGLRLRERILLSFTHPLLFSL